MRDIGEFANDAIAGIPLDWHPVWTETVGAGASARYRPVSVPRPGDATSPADGGDVIVEQSQARTLPGHLIWRVRRFPCGLFAATADETMRALAGAARRPGRVLRCRVQLYALDTGRLDACRDAALRAGFRVVRPESYRQTVLVDLRSAGEGLIERLGGNARRDIRRMQRSGFRVAPLTDVAFASRLAELEGETKARTGGRYATQPWAEWLSFARGNPELARIAGLFTPSGATPAHLVGFALACRHGGLVEYRTAATARPPGVKVPLAYGPAWDLLCWAESLGATCFDFGGAVDSSAGQEHPLVRISRFKRNFRDRITRVGEEMLFVPHPRRARLADNISGIVRRLGRR